MRLWQSPVSGLILLSSRVNLPLEQFSQYQQARVWSYREREKWAGLCFSLMKQERKIIINPYYLLAARREETICLFYNKSPSYSEGITHNFSMTFFPMAWHGVTWSVLSQIVSALVYICWWVQSRSENGWTWKMCPLTLCSPEFFFFRSHWKALSYGKQGTEHRSYTQDKWQRLHGLDGFWTPQCWRIRILLLKNSKL